MDEFLVPVGEFLVPVGEWVSSTDLTLPTMRHHRVHSSLASWDPPIFFLPQFWAKTVVLGFMMLPVASRLDLSELAYIRMLAVGRGRGVGGGRGLGR